MAKQKGLLKIEGTLDDLTFFKTEDGFVVRTKGGVSRDRILRDPSFIRTRENMTEFAHCAGTGKMLRRAAADLIRNVKDKRVTGRLTGTMARIKNYDTVSPRGQRKVDIGVTTPQGLALLKGFDFNTRSQLTTVMTKPWSLDTATGEVVIANLIPQNNIVPPEYATHVSFTAAFMMLDFATGESQVYQSNVVNLPIDLAATTVTLTPDDVPTGSGTAMYFLLVEFFQEINSVQYTLKNGSYNALSIIQAL
tara:strand:+ start:26127 stop:26876 length:750 start_codon:yes stop_codon:yes gene_type:complete